MTLVRTYAAIGLVILAFGIAGCTSEVANTGQAESSPPPATIDPHAGHAHASEGPHHGELIELGNEEYHAELLHDGSSVTIYVLSGAADQQVAIDATEIVINTTHDGKPEQFQLAAKPDASDQFTTTTSASPGSSQSRRQGAHFRTTHHRMGNGEPQ